MVGIILIIFSVLLYFVFAIQYYTERVGELQISFRQFREMYKLNPEKWRERSGYVVYHTKDDDNQRIYFSIYFKSFYDYLRTAWYMHRIRKKEVDILKDKTMVMLLGEWQKDLDTYRQKYTDEINKMMREVDYHQQASEEKDKILELYNSIHTEKKPNDL